MDIRARPATSHFVGVFSYAGMPEDEAERNMRLFAREVLPELKKHEAGSAPGAPAAPAEPTVNAGLIRS